ncbi:transcription factor Adf-1-like [Engraulis encrasicolus]|uniref:transcription factor Adf-1-like n=1 Tax=Engraulis encrasicolus TaxID=184585 RepID=UPI002FCF511F
MNMEERLIYAVSLYPELYNSSLSSYKDYSKKADAWRSVSLQSEAPEEDCRRKWKSLRDQFIKEQRRTAMGNGRKWKFTEQMAFLTPFIQCRTSMGNYVVEGEDDTDKEMNNNSGHGSRKMRDGATPPHFPVWPGHKRWELNGEGNEDEMFLLSLLPHLKKLSYEKKCAVKLKFHQLLYEAEFQ